jgi:hypothetical protein
MPFAYDKVGSRHVVRKYASNAWRISPEIRRSRRARIIITTL